MQQPVIGKPAERKNTPFNKNKGLGKGMKGLGGAKKHRKVLRNNIDGMSKPMISRAARRAGVIRIEMGVYDSIRMLIKLFMEKLLKQVVLLVDYERKRTVSFEMVDMAYFFAFGRHYIGGEKTPITGGVSDVKQYVGRKDGVRRKMGTAALAEVRFYQKNSDSTIIPFEPFARLTREVAQDYKDDLRFSESSINLMRFLLEEYLVAIFDIANDFVVHSNRRTVETKDVALANKYCQ